MITISIALAAWILATKGMMWEGVAACFLLTIMLDAALFAFLIACHYGLVKP